MFSKNLLINLLILGQNFKPGDEDDFDNLAKVVTRQHKFDIEDLHD